MQKFNYKCPYCNSQVKQFNGKYGLYWSCTDFQNCGKKFKEKNHLPVFPEISDARCWKCYHRLVKLFNKRNKPFWGCSGFPKCKETYQDINGEPDIKGALLKQKLNNKKDK